jgi:hypothetical protein
MVLPVLTLAMAGCGGDEPAASSPASDPAATASGSPGALASARPTLTASLAPGTDLCAQIATARENLASLQGVELRLPNRVALEIELGKLQASFSDLEQADLGPFAEQLEGPLTRLGYRLGEVELAVEDFRTNPRPQRAAPHVETDTRTFSDELAAFAILARC